MTEHDLPELDQGLLDLLDAEKTAPGPGRAVEDRVLSAVQGTIGLPPTPGGTAQPAPSSGLGTAATGTGAAKAALALAIFGGGAIVGAFTHAQLTEPEVRVERVIVKVPTTEPRPATPIEPQPEPQPERAPKPRPTRPKPKPKPKPTKDTLVKERLLLETARTALSRGNNAAALEALKTHAKNHPKGQLEEERRALEIMALERLGKTEDAKKKRKRFKHDYPNSLFLR